MEEITTVIKFIAPVLGSLFGLLGGALAYRVRGIVSEQQKDFKSEIEKQFEEIKHCKEKDHDVIYDKIETLQKTSIDLCKTLARHDERISALRELAERCEKRRE